MKESEIDERVAALLSGENMRTRLIDALSDRHDVALLRDALRAAQRKRRALGIVDRWPIQPTEHELSRTYERLAQSALTPLVLFSAYTAAASRRSHLRTAFGRLHGIAVSDDPIARRWQRRERQISKIATRLLVLLGDADMLERYPRLCPLCGYYRSHCAHADKGD